MPKIITGVKGILISALFSGLISGCAVKMNATVTMPANESSVLLYRTVAVFPFKSRNGVDYTSKFEAVLASAKENGKNIFMVVDRENIDKVMKEQKFQMSISDPDSMVEMGKLLGAEAMWTGSSDSSYSEAGYTEKRTRCGSDGKSCYDYTVNCVKKSVSMDLTPKLISTSTGMVVYSSRISENVSVGVCRDYSIQVTRNELESEALEKVLASFRQDVAPYDKNIYLELMSGAGDISDKDSKKLLKEGLGFAKDKRLDRACGAWKKALEKSPEAVSPAYNYALCLEIKGDYEGALKSFEELEAVIPPSGSFDRFLDMFSLKAARSRLVKEAIDRNKKNLENRERLKAQMGK